MRALRVLMAAVFFLVVAQSASATPVDKYDRTVYRVQIGSDGSVLMYLATGTDSSCPDRGSRFTLSEVQNGGLQTEKGVKAALAVVLTTVATGKLLSLAYEPGTCQVYWVMVST